MIKLTVKTLDASNHDFEVEDSLSVKELKELVAKKVGVDVSQQRLIFCGRVLKDEQKLAECDVDGKVLHLVLRAPPEERPAPPPPPPQPQATAPPITTFYADPNLLVTQQLRRLLTLSTPPGYIVDDTAETASSPATARLIHLRLLLKEIKMTLRKLSEHDDGPSRPQLPPDEDDSSDSDEEIEGACCLEAIKVAQEEARAMSEERRAAYAEYRNTLLAEGRELPVEDELRWSEDRAREREARENPEAAVEPATAQEPEAATAAAADEPQQRRLPRRTPVARARDKFIRSLRPVRQYYSRPRDFGDLLDELKTLEERFAYYRSEYVDLLRNVNSRSYPEMTPEQQVRRQHWAELIAELFHSFSHAYHAVSDITLLVASGNSRLTADRTALRQPIPVQAHINIAPDLRRMEEQQRQRQQASQETQQASTEQDDLDDQDREEEQLAEQFFEHVQRNPDIFDQVRYDLEILQQQDQPEQAQTQQNPENQPRPALQPITAETFLVQDRNDDSESESPSEADQLPPLERGGATGEGSSFTFISRIHPERPIPINVTGAMMPGRNTNTNRPINISVQPDPITYQVEIETRVPMVAFENVLGVAQDQNGTQDGANQANRRQVLTDIENMFRGLSQTGGLAGLGGVEFVMSMEEIQNMAENSSGAGTGTGTGPGTGPGTGAGTGPGAGQPQPNGTPNQQAQPNSGAQMPWGPPNLNFIQNMLSSAIRMGMVPGTGVESIVQVPLTGLIPGQIPAQVTAQANNRQRNPQMQGNPRPQVLRANRMAAGRPNVQSRPNATNAPRQQSVRLGPAVVRPPIRCISMDQVLYDRLLPCTSIHSRRQLNRRRQVFMGVRPTFLTPRMDPRTGRPYREQDDRTPGTIRTLMDRFEAPDVDPMESLLIALLVSSDEVLSPPTHRYLIPEELEPYRQRMQSYIRDMIHSSSNRNHDTNLIIQCYMKRLEHFFQRMPQIVRVVETTDVPGSILMLFERYMSELVSVLEIGNADTFASRYRVVFPRFFHDLFSIIAHSLVDGFEGVRQLISTYLRELTTHIVEPSRSTIYNLAMSMFNRAGPVIVNNEANILHYICRRRRAAVPGPSAPPAEQETQAAPTVQQPTPTEQTEAKPDEPMDLDEPEESIDIDLPSEESEPPSEASSADKPDNVAEPALGQPDSDGSPPRVNNAMKPETPKRFSPDAADVRIMPQIMIVQHWGQEWVPVFTDDQRSQTDAAAYSDAYVCGMPSRKRRCVRQARPTPTIDGFMTESIQEALESTPETQSEEMREAFREHVRGMIRERTARSEDYDPLRYASVARFVADQSALPQPQSGRTTENPGL